MSKTERLIEIVRKYPILYDLSHRDHKNSRKKDKIWMEIGRELNGNADDMKKKWKNLKDSYAKFIKGTKTIAGQSVNITKKWVWAEQMEFFRPCLVNATTSTSISDGFRNEDFPNESSCDEIDMRNNILEKSLDIEFEHSAHSSSVPPIELRATGTPETKSTSAGKKTTDNNKSGPPAPVGRDNTECLMLAHAQTIKTFNPKLQALTKMKIAQLLMEQELLEIEEKETNLEQMSNESNTPDAPDDLNCQSPQQMDNLSNSEDDAKIELRKDRKLVGVGKIFLKMKRPIGKTSSLNSRPYSHPNLQRFNPQDPPVLQTNIKQEVDKEKLLKDKLLEGLTLNLETFCEKFTLSELIDFNANFNANVLINK